MPVPQPSYHPEPRKPALRLPPGACDTHCHVFGPAAAFPYAADAPFLPADAPKERLFALHKHLGIERCVVVQSTCHGYDNRVTEDVLAAKPGAYLGVALLPLSVPAAELQRLDAVGFRAVRFNFMRHLGKGARIDEVIAFGARLADLGWHLQVHFEAALIDELAPSFARAPVPVVIDHMGRVDAALGLEQPAFRSLCTLLRNPNIWVKLSGADRASRAGPPYADAVPLARSLAREFGDRVLWGTDWPHPNHAGPVPDDGALVDLIGEIAPGEAARQALLVDNPARLYRFAGRERKTA